MLFRFHCRLEQICATFLNPSAGLCCQLTSFKALGSAGEWVSNANKEAKIRISLRVEPVGFVPSQRDCSNLSLSHTVIISFRITRMRIYGYIYVTHPSVWKCIQKIKSVDSVVVLLLLYVKDNTSLLPPSFLHLSNVYYSSYPFLGLVLREILRPIQGNSWPQRVYSKVG